MCPAGPRASCAGSIPTRHRIRGWHSTASSAAATRRVKRESATFVDVRATPNPPPLVLAHLGVCCADWDSSVNPLAANRKLRKELLAVGPYCISEDQTTVYCSPNATRTQRSGVYDIKYMARDDRSYCELQFARERLAPESGADIETCRTNLTARFERCALTCDSCAAECTSAAARNLVSAWRCSFGMPVLGIMAAMQVTDQGVEIANRWGADRTRGLIATPDDAWTEQFRTLVQNSVDRPRIARSAISCRKSHRESSTGGFVPTLDDDGKHIARQGFMVGCNTDLDCYSRCGEHPISGSPYVCTHKPQFYTHAGDSRDAFDKLVKQAAAQKANNQPHQRVWRPDSGDHNFYFVDEPGDDAMDPGNMSMGVCTDFHAAYANTGCLDPLGGQVTFTLAGAGMRWNPAVNMLFCGLLIEHGESDFVTDIGISESSLIYPRTLVHEAQVNGVVRPSVTCWNPFDCDSKCEFFRKNAREGLLTEPAGCVLCRPPVPTNFATWILDVRDAIMDDVVTALRLAAVCLNPVACACQVFMMVRQLHTQTLLVASRKLRVVLCADETLVDRLASQ